MSNKVIIESAVYGKGVNLINGDQRQFFESIDQAEKYINENLKCDYAELEIEYKTKGNH